MARWVLPPPRLHVFLGRPHLPAGKNARGFHCRTRIGSGITVLRIPNEFICKGVLEEALIPHTIRDERIVIRDYHVPLACLGLGSDLTRNREWENAPMENSLALVSHLSGFTMRSKAGTRIGGRMGETW